MSGEARRFTVALARSPGEPLTDVDLATVRGACMGIWRAMPLPRTAALVAVPGTTLAELAAVPDELERRELFAGASISLDMGGEGAVLVLSPREDLDAPWQSRELTTAPDIRTPGERRHDQRHRRDHGRSRPARARRGR
jgi:hypothetical protein